MTAQRGQPDPAASLAPLLASLAGLAAVMLTGVPLDRRLRQPVVTSNPVMPASDIPPAAFAPPPHGGRGRIVIGRCEPAGPRFLLYEPHELSRRRSYPLLVWLAESPPDALAANDLARRWGESADRDRYFALMAQSTGDSEADARTLARICDYVRQFRHIDAGPVLLAAKTTPRIAGHDFAAVAGPLDVPAVLADERLWPTPVQIDVRPRVRAKLPVVVYLQPIVAARLGPVDCDNRDAYQWDLKAFDLPASRLKFQCFRLNEPGDYPVRVRVRMKSGREVVGRATISATTTAPSSQ